MRSLADRQADEGSREARLQTDETDVDDLFEGVRTETLARHCNRALRATLAVRASYARLLL